MSEDGSWVQAAIENFPWESDAQREGFLGFMHWQYSKFDFKCVLPLQQQYLPLIFLIQKLNEANEWSSETLGTQVSILQDELMKARAEIESLKESVRHHTSTLELTVSTVTSLVNKSLKS